MPSGAPDRPTADLATLVRSLADAGVDFVIVGALAAVAQGAPLTTFDVDAVHARTPANLDALLACLTQLDARYRGRPPGEILRPDRDGLAGVGHHLLQTSLGPLDLLGAIEGGATYDDLLPESVDLDLDGTHVRVLSLEALVRLKRTAPDDKAKLQLPVLEATLRRLRGE